MFYGQQIQGPPNPQQPLSYVGGSPNEVVFDRQPNPTDNNPYLIGCRWTIPVSESFPTGEFWVLVSLVNGLATWKKLEGHTESAETLTGNTGGPVGPDANNNINVVGTGTLVVTGTPSNNTLTISRTGSTGYIGLINKIYITATGSGTYTPSSNLIQAYVECVGAGGGSGSYTSTEGSGAGAGGYCAKMFTAADIGASKTYSVGAGGAAGASNSDGSAGGNTTFAGVMTASGGGGGISADATVNLGGAGGSASGGDINIIGQSGIQGYPLPTGGPNIAISGTGGSTIYGLGGIQLIGRSVSPTQSSGTGYGAGAGGSTSGTGSAGQNGIIIITEYLS